MVAVSDLVLLLDVVTPVRAVLFGLELRPRVEFVQAAGYLSLKRYLVPVMAKNRVPGLQFWWRLRLTMQTSLYQL